MSNPRDTLVYIDCVKSVNDDLSPSVDLHRLFFVLGELLFTSAPYVSNSHFFATFNYFPSSAIYSISRNHKPSTWYQVLGIKCLVPSTWYQVLGTGMVRGFGVTLTSEGTMRLNLMNRSCLLGKGIRGSGHVLRWIPCEQYGRLKS